MKISNSYSSSLVTIESCLEFILDILYWGHLPPNIVNLYLHNNRFDGNIELDVLPSSLKDLHVSSNQFTSVTGNKREDLTVFEIDEN